VRSMQTISSRPADRWPEPGRVRKEQAPPPAMSAFLRWRWASESGHKPEARVALAELEAWATPPENLTEA
jgi:hypothetical protein